MSSPDILMQQCLKKRIQALYHLQNETLAINVLFFEEIHALECKYNKLYLPLYEKRSMIISGAHEPNDEESVWLSDIEEEVLGKELLDKTKVHENGTEKTSSHAETLVAIEHSPANGILDFWLTIFRNDRLLSYMLHEDDVPIITCLIDIRPVFHVYPMSFTLQFHFAPNEYFNNAILTKEYYMKNTPYEEDLYSFQGPEIIKCKGCTINWNEGKNITLKTIRKQNHKDLCITYQSFFNFFSPPLHADDIYSEDVDEDTRNLLFSDFTIGYYIREKIAPRALIFYRGKGMLDSMMKKN